MNKNFITVEKKDITRIGNTAFNKNGNLAIVCNGETSNIEGILLRSILKCFGDDYKVVSSEDNIWVNVKGEEVYDILFTTNLPYELFEEVWHSEDSDAGTMPNTPKKSSKIVKSILTIIMLVFIGLAANAQEVHGYSKHLANKLGDVGFTFVSSGYVAENTGELSDIYCVTTATPKYYDEEQARAAVDNLLNQYSDVILYEPWHEKQWKKQSIICCGYEATYILCGDTQLSVTIFNAAQFTNKCYVYLYEGLIEELCKH